MRVGAARSQIHLKQGLQEQCGLLITAWSRELQSWADAAHGLVQPKVAVNPGRPSVRFKNILELLFF